MKHLDEYRNADLSRKYLDEIHRITTRPWSVMEICGGQTHSFLKHGIIDLLPSQITLVHGPGCPVCVTPAGAIDFAIQIAHTPNTLLCSFGDMMRVPGSSESLLGARASGGQVQMVYSPLDAVALAEKNPQIKVVFFAVGFETTAPANALAVLQAHKRGLKNFFLLVSQVLVPPAMEALLADVDTRVDGFLAAGHVCAVMGTDQYLQVALRHRVPIVVTGFEPVDLLKGLLSCIEQLESGRAELQNQYSRVVTDLGNSEAKSMIGEVFEVADQEWRGIGILENSGLRLKDKYSNFDARNAFQLIPTGAENQGECIAGQILKGLKKPKDCTQFGTGCTPQQPKGAPMVSTEGACAAYFNYHFTS